MSEAMNQELFKDIVTIIARHSKNQEAMAAASVTSDILKDLDVNSARFVDIVLDFEDRFDIKIDDDDLDNINTVGDAYKLVEKLKH